MSELQTDALTDVEFYLEEVVRVTRGVKSRVASKQSTLEATVDWTL